jgi:hypothetical protein
MNRFPKFIIYLVLIFLVSSCAKKNLEILVAPVIEYKIKDRVLANILDSLSLLKLNYFYAKLKIDFKDNDNDLSFKTSLKIVSDSAINAIVTKVGFPIANALIRIDSVKILNIPGKCYIKNSWDNFRDLLKLEIDYLNLENILLGRPLTAALNQKYFVDKEDYEVAVTNLREDSNLSLQVDTLLKSTLMINYILTSDLKDIAQTRIYSATDSTEIQIQYVSRQVISELKLPNKTIISLFRPNYNLVINLEYDNLEVNKKIGIIFIIPEKYEVCK